MAENADVYENKAASECPPPNYEDISPPVHTNNVGILLSDPAVDVEIPLEKLPQVDSIFLIILPVEILMRLN